jgi:hypothetical protein
MPLEKTFREFSTGIRRLRDRMEELRVTVVEDKPTRNDAAVVDGFEYAVEDVWGWLNETLEAAKIAERAVGHPVDIEKARHALSTCQERFHRMEHAFTENLLSYERVKDLTSFGTERRGEWPAWVISVKQGIDHCRLPLQDTGKALAECWQEIAERNVTTSISVNATNVGQKIVSSRSAAGERLRESAT